MRIDELNTKIIEWACECEVDRKGIIQGQAIKTIEEVSELVRGICENDIDLIKDNIGDVYVTLVAGCMLNNTRVCTNYTLDGGRYRSEEPMLERITNEMLKLSVCNESYDYSNVAKLVKLLESIAIEYKTSSSGCVQLACNEVSSGKGKTIDGVFVKEADLR